MGFGCDSSLGTRKSGGILVALTKIVSGAEDGSGIAPQFARNLIAAYSLI
jgi:hypothetical protein